jgi:hypothetical protein
MRRAMMVLAALVFVLVQPAVGKPPGPTSSAVTIAAAPNPVVFGSSSLITGQVTGKKAAGATVDLQSEPFPYKAGFSKVASATADATGRYSFKVAPGLNTLYRVIAKTAPSATSANALVHVRVSLSLGVSTTHPAAGQLVRFSGFLLPAYSGRSVQIQRKTATGWKTVAQTKLVAATPVNGVARSKYRKRVRIRRSGTYRAFFNPADGARLPNGSPTRRLTVH